MVAHPAIESEDAQQLTKGNHMHKGVILLVKASNRNEAKGKAETFLSQHDQENGTGVWDWYVIGGRWTGTLTGYDPEADPANNEKCDTCGGTGKRTDEVAEANPSLKERCNGCGGKGHRVKWPTEWKPHAGDITRASDPKAAEKIKEWSDGWAGGVREQLTQSRKAFKGQKSMQEYLRRKERELRDDVFQFDSNVFDVDRNTNVPPADLSGYWAVMIDMHS